MSSADGGDAFNAIDNDNTTLAQTGTSHLYPYLIIDMARSIRVTKVSILGGEEPFTNPLMNMDIRVGNTSNSGYDPNVKMTNNIRCIDPQFLLHVSEIMLCLFKMWSVLWTNTH